MIDKFNGGYAGIYWFQNGGEWGIEAFNDYKSVYVDQGANRIPSDSSVRIIELLRHVEELPFLITVNTKSGKKFHILHAELPSRSGIQITDEVLTDSMQVNKLATMQRGDGEAFLWFRHLFNNMYCSNLENREKIIRSAAWVDTSIFNDKLSHIISGHTILQKPITFMGQTNIDTGAYSSYHRPVEPYGRGYVAPVPWARLTCVELDTWNFYQATETTFNTVEPFIIAEKEINDTRKRNGAKGI